MSDDIQQLSDKIDELTNQIAVLKGRSDGFYSAKTFLIAAGIVAFTIIILNFIGNDCRF